jgi:hypothetical protein
MLLTEAAMLHMVQLLAGTVDMLLTVLLLEDMPLDMVATVAMEDISNRLTFKLSLKSQLTWSCLQLILRLLHMASNSSSMLTNTSELLALEP